MSRGNELTSGKSECGEGSGRRRRSGSSMWRHVRGRRRGARQRSRYACAVESPAGDAPFTTLAIRTHHCRFHLSTDPNAHTRTITPQQAAQCLMCEGAGSFSTVCPHQRMATPGLRARELGAGIEGGDKGGSQRDAGNGPITKREGGGSVSWDIPDKRETLPWGRAWRSGRQTTKNATAE